MLLQENMLKSTRIPNFARVLWVCPRDCHSEHVNIHAKRQNFNRASNFVSVLTLYYPEHLSSRQKHTSEELPVVTLKCLLFFQKGKNKKKIIPPEAIARRCSVNKVVLKSFTKFTGKHSCQSLSFNKFTDLRLWHKCFPVNFVKIWRRPFLKKISRGCFYSSSVLDTLETLHQN